MKTPLLILLILYCACNSRAQSLQPGLDPTFGKLGRVTDIIDSGVRYRDVTGIAIQPDGKIITTGQFILRFHPDGRLDSSFGGTGLIKPPSLTYPEASYAKGVLLQPDGKIVITGTVYNPRMN
jgi:hypothetical protein